MSRQSNSSRMSRRDLIIGATNSLNRRSHSATSENPVRGSISTSCLASPGIRRRGNMNASGRTGSPLTLPMENLQSMNAAYSTSQTYLGEGLGNAMSSTSISPRSPYHSSSSGQASRSGSSRQLQGNFDSVDPYPHETVTYPRSASIRDHSKERSPEPSQRYYATYSGRDRSLDRSQLHMGARTLDRERSRSIDHEFLADEAVFFPSVPDVHHNTKDMLILDLQARIAQLNKECAVLGEEMKSTKEKLNSSMNSIKTFWSPELKKERAARKEDIARNQALTDQLNALQAEYESERGKRKTPDHQQQQQAGLSAADMPDGRPSRELAILRQTVEEMELRIDTQKQTLAARDESVRKLLEMLQGRGTKHGGGDGAEMERLRTAAADDQRRIRHLESLLKHKERDVCKLQEDLRNSETNQTLPPLHKDSQIESLQQEVESLQTQLRQRDEADGATSSHSAAETAELSLQLETVQSQERLLKAKLENVRSEVARKDTELYSVRTQLEASDKQGIDHLQRIDVLREQITAKEQQVAMLQGDVEMLQNRLKEKDATIQQKGQQCVTLQNEKKKLETDVNEGRDHTAIRERKINMLQRKVEAVEETLKLKEDELSLLKARLTTLHADHDTSSGTVANLEEALASKEKIIDRLKEEHRQSDEEHQEELSRQQTVVKQLKNNTETLQMQLQQEQTELLSLRDEISELRSERLRLESDINHLNISESQKTAEVEDLRQRLKTLEEQKASELNRNNSELNRKLEALQQELKGEQEGALKNQAEVDRLLAILKQSEDEKRDLDQQIKDLTEQLKDSRQKMAALKRTQQLDKSKNAQMLEEARMQEQEATKDNVIMKQLVEEREQRIEELEEALRESVRITAQREMVLLEQTEQLKLHEEQANTVTDELERLKKSSNEYSSELCQVSQQLEAKENSLQYMQLDRQQELHEVYEMKQEAILAAISEKDAHIGLLEMVPNSNQKNIAAVEQLTREKIKLQKQLKEVTDNRMKLMLEQTCPTAPSPTNVPQDNVTAKPVDQPAGIWT